jgi:hypothetical protein
MKYKRNWDESRERLCAVWEGRVLDRPCLAAYAPNGRGVQAPVPVSGEQRWLDPGFNVRAMLAQFESTHYAGEALPGWLLMAGWTANAYGATPHFPLETIWFEPRRVDWDRPPSFPLDWEDPWLGKVTALHEAVLGAAGRDDFIVGQGCFMPGNDMLALVIGAERMLTGMHDRPEWIKRSIMQLARNWVSLVRHFHGLARKTSEFWYGNSGWMDLWLPEPYVTAQSDISCMISPDMFDEFIVPELELVGAEFGNVWYHLDGQGAVKHLPRLLSLPSIKAVQFVPEAGTAPNGPEHLALYRRIQEAGRILHIDAPPRNIEPLVRALDPSRLVLCTYCGSAADADELVSRSGQWMKSRK